jgi:predicted flap endonuclease-1-like 5' DNA nuclease
MDAAGPLALVVLGIIIGWFIELVIDFLVLRPYWMSQGRELIEPAEHIAPAPPSFDDELSDALATLKAMHAEQNAARFNAHLAEQAERAAPDGVVTQRALDDFSETLDAHTKALVSLEELVARNLDASETLGASLSARINESSEVMLDEIQAMIIADMPVRQDRLTDIKGIGPSYANRLHEFGVFTFRQLAALTPDEIISMMNMGTSALMNPQSWIEQAKLIVSGRTKAKAEIEEAS